MSPVRAEIGMLRPQIEIIALQEINHLLSRDTIVPIRAIVQQTGQAIQIGITLHRGRKIMVQ